LQERRFRHQVLDRDHTLVLQIEGDLDLDTAPLLAEKLNEVEAAGPRSVTVDLNRVEFMDSSGLQVLLSRASLNGNGSRFAVTRGSAQVRRLFEVAGVIDLLTFADP
jgi:anti-sigma B factor antagonist